MRLIAFFLTLLVISVPAAAQSWKEYTDPDNGFTVSFPADPKIETTTYQAADGRVVEAKVYSFTQDGAVFKMTVADLSHAAMEESAVMTMRSRRCPGRARSRSTSLPASTGFTDAS